MAVQQVLQALGTYGLKRAASGWIARCPAHDDRKASLTLAQGDDGRVLMHCQAGCETSAVVEQLGLAMGDLFPPKDPSKQARIVAEYDYRDEGGTRLYQVVRFDPKDFRQRRPAPEGWTWKLGDVRRVLYRLPQLLLAPPESPVFIVEGEKDADRLATLGLVATTNVGGAGKWRPEYSGALRGRQVVILPDNDEPGSAHAIHVAKALAGVAADVRIVKLPGLPPKGDVSDWLHAGGTAEKLLALVAKSAIQTRVQSFQASPERVKNERQERIELGAQVLSFGVHYLDHAVGGITSRDLVLIGAKTGLGKTALATTVAFHNGQRGKRVHYFALEAEDKEIERRIKFQIIADEYYRTGVHRPPIRYLDWYLGRLDTELAGWEAWADEQLKVVLGNLKTYYRLESFTGDDFSRCFDEIREETDLVVLDHFHYVDTADENENRGSKRTVKQIRDSALNAGKPVLVVAHVRKGDRRFEPLVPTLEDFHGSSDLTKIATKAVMLAPAYDVPAKLPHLWNTYMQIGKCRLDTSVTKYVALIVYDARRNGYEDAYILGRLTEGGKSFAHLTADEMPAWASATT